MFTVWAHNCPFTKIGHKGTTNFAYTQIKYDFWYKICTYKKKAVLLQRKSAKSRNGI